MNGWRRRPRRKRRPSVSAEPKRKRSGGRAETPRQSPQPVEDTPDDKAQMSFTDPELHIMRTNNKGWEYCGNAQVSVDGTCQIIVACDVTDARTTNSRLSRLRKRHWPIWPRPVLSPRRTRRARRKPSQRLWIMAITVRQQWRRWRPEGLIHTSPPSASGTMGRRPRP